ncbi:protein CHROMATIN REMODELING 35 [Setaria viridis]
MDPAGFKRQKRGNEPSSPGTQSQSDIFLHNRCLRLQFLEQLRELKTGSFDLKAINTKRRELIGIIERLQQVPIQQLYASPVPKPSDSTPHNFGQIGRNYSSNNVIDLDADKDNFKYHTQANVGNISADSTVSAVDSDDKDRVKSFGHENSSPNQNANYIGQHLLLEQPVRHQEIIKLDNCSSSTEPQVKKVKGGMDTDNGSVETKKIILFDSHSTSGQQPLIKQVHGNINTNIEDDLEEKGKVGRTLDKYVGSYEVPCEIVQNELQSNESNHHEKDSPVDELDDLWVGMSVALACSEINQVGQNIVPIESNREETEDACNHDFLMKDDLGIVCRICGLIQKRIESIFEHSWKKCKQTYRTYPAKHRKSSDPDSTENPLGTNLNVVPDALSIHPQHSQQMKPHQVEGFNFLIKNLADQNNPGGCILAHAPGSGKTFLLISFVHSFLARYPAGRPLIMLPKGILGTWKSEFLRWQVENIPLYDFYSSKANSRSEQCKILKLWEENRSILLLGYQQFAHIISDDSSDRETLVCREKLLRVPSLVILDEGHTSRNDQTDLLSALETIQTPRKVVLTGTLFQNHVSEVFNILNLVRPKFLKMQRSRAIMKRILTKVDMVRTSVRSKTISEKVFYELIEENLQKDSKTMRVMIIQNLRELTENILHYYQGEILKELPGLVDFTVFLNMSTKQEDVVKDLVGLKRFEAHAKCNVVSLHPCLKDVKNVDKKNRNISKRKMGSIVHGIDINDGVKARFIYNLLSLSEAAGEKVLVFSQYVRSLDFLEMLFTKMKGWKAGVNTFLMDGGLTQEQREQAVERFNNSPEAKVFLGSIKACGEGISLVGASRVVILDVHENPAVMRQAIGRAFRPGQSKMVYCYRLIAAGTLEEADHHTAFKKEQVSKLWFEWDELCNNEDFELTKVDVSDCKDRFLESSALQEDIKSLFKR